MPSGARPRRQGTSDAGSAPASRSSGRRTKLSGASTRMPTTPSGNAPEENLLSPFDSPAKPIGVPKSSDESGDKDAPLAQRLRHTGARSFMANVRDPESGSTLAQGTGDAGTGPTSQPGSRRTSSPALRARMSSTPPRNASEENLLSPFGSPAKPIGLPKPSDESGDKEASSAQQARKSENNAIITDQKFNSAAMSQSSERDPSSPSRKRLKTKHDDAVQLGSAIERLPDEILNQIVSYVDDKPTPSTMNLSLQPSYGVTKASSRDLKALSRASHRSRNFTLPRLFRSARVLLNCCEEASDSALAVSRLRDFLDFIQSAQLGRFMESFTVEFEGPIESLTAYIRPDAMKPSTWAWLWPGLFSIANPTRLTILAPPHVLCALVDNGSSLESYYACSTRYKLLSLVQAQACDFARDLSRPPESLFQYRPWTTLVLNEGKALLNDNVDWKRNPLPISPTVMPNAKVLQNSHIRHLTIVAIKPNSPFLLLPNNLFNTIETLCIQQKPDCCPRSTNNLVATPQLELRSSQQRSRLYGAGMDEIALARDLGHRMNARAFDVKLKRLELPDEYDCFVELVLDCANGEGRGNPLVLKEKRPWRLESAKAIVRNESL